MEAIYEGYLLVTGGFFSRAAWIGLALAVAGCADKKEPPPVELEIKPPMGQVIDFTIEASPLINPNPENMPSPVVVRLYILSSPTAFTDANFFQLWEKDEATLGATQLAKFETTLIPGGVKKIDAKLPDKAALVGVTVGFRDYRTAKWRAIVPFTGERTSKLKVQVLTNSVKVVPQE